MEVSKKPGAGPGQGLRGLEDHAADLLVELRPYFVNQPEGSLDTSRVSIQFGNRMGQKLGLAYLFERRIVLNRRHFETDRSRLPHTLFHELTHLWLYDCQLDPGHTARFYKKMKDFDKTGYPQDPSVHVHTRVASEGRHVYSCPNCQNRWFLKREISYSLYCGPCFDREGMEYFARPQEMKAIASSPSGSVESAA